MGEIIDEVSRFARKFPDQAIELRRRFMADEAFRDSVRDYNDAAAALEFWSEAASLSRQQEYGDIMIELEHSILDRLERGPMRTL